MEATTIVRGNGMPLTVSAECARRGSCSAMGQCGCDRIDTLFTCAHIMPGGQACGMPVILADGRRSHAERPENNHHAPEMYHQMLRQRWLWDHRKDAGIIPLLTDSELVTHRLCADIRADYRVLNPATAELRRRGIRDYPIAI